MHGFQPWYFGNHGPPPCITLTWVGTIPPLGSLDGFFYTNDFNSLIASGIATSWTLTGSIPSGLTLNTSTGVFSGTPSGAGTYNMTLTAYNACTPSITTGLVMNIS